MYGLEIHWLWLIAGAVLAVGEIVIPGIFLIWIGLAAFMTGVVTMLLPIPVALQFLFFAATAVASIYASRRFLKQNPIASADPLLNDRAARLIGEIVTAVEPVDADQGRVKVGDGVWSARGASAAVGERLRVVGIERNVLIVESV